MEYFLHHNILMLVVVFILNKHILIQALTLNQGTQVSLFYPRLNKTGFVFYT